jgi:hypothetical protein
VNHPKFQTETDSASVHNRWAGKMANLHHLDSSLKNWEIRNHTVAVLCFNKQKDLNQTKCLLHKHVTNVANRVSILKYFPYFATGCFKTEMENK